MLGKIMPFLNEKADKGLKSDIRKILKITRRNGNGR